MDPLTPRPGETCTMMWDRLTAEERAVAQCWQNTTQHATMTSWLLARGCVPVYQPPHPSRYRSPDLSTNFVGRRVIRRPAEQCV